MKQNIPLTRDLVLVGGGHSHALVLRMWGMNPLPGVRLTVINPGPTAPYSGMLPGFVAGHYTRDDLDIDLVQLTRFAGARVIVGRAIALDPVGKTVTIEGRGPIAYDVASVDIGITSEIPQLDGFAEHAIPAKPLGRFAATWDAYRNSATDPKVAVIGGGVAGAELAMAMAHALRDRNPVVSLIDRGEVLEEFEEATRSRLMDSLAEQGVEVVEHADVVRIEKDAVILADGQRIASDYTNGAAGARPQGWLAGTGLDTHQGYLTVGPTLQTSDPDVFAVGDCAHLEFDPRPKAGVYAVREAPVLFDNLRAHLSGRGLRGYKPQKDYLKLISLGRKSALAEKLGTARKWPLLWKWKNHIDTKFMRQFRELKFMTPEPPLVAAEGVQEVLGKTPMCAGCGSKVGRNALETALNAVPDIARTDVLSAPGDDAAILKMGKTVQVLTVDHLSAVTEDPALMARIAAVHALGDIWAMGAAPQSALLSLILPRMSADLQARTLAEIMQAAGAVLNEAGAAIVGGHTTQGDTLTIGLTLTGIASRAPITVAGAQPGDALILTKPIGSGTLLAAEMQGKARGEDVLACYDAMVQPQGTAAEILAQAHAMTDVTGFGLAGHLSAICRASGVGAELTGIPMLQGAEALAQAGIRSTLYPDNLASSLPVNGADGPRMALLFDPQTCGGLLAALDASEADAAVQALQEAGYPASRIGTVVDGSGITLL